MMQKMGYFNRILFIFIVLIFSIQQGYAFYPTDWKTVYEAPNIAQANASFTGMIISGRDSSIGNGYSYVELDRESVNIHNDSIYYAIKYGYSKNNEYGDYVSIIQSKNNKAGIVKTYTLGEYNIIMQNHLENLHPAYEAKEAKNLKEIDSNSFIYNANELAKKAVELKKRKRVLFNGLYEL